ncbi:MAG: RNase adapter RapZ [Oscillospiraceae bacterium]|nr:RNase adapter RapZ [Oscillospiraceae bacterium]
MNFVIVTGLSGAGKSKTIEMLEDIDFVCVDNLPPKLIPAFGQILQKSEQDFKTAVVTDIRSGNGFKALFESLDELKNMGIEYKIIFIDADEKTLVNRYKETRRKHPLLNKYNDSVLDAVRAEKEILEPVRHVSDFVIDTTHLSAKQLKDRVASLFLENLQQTMQIQCLSFGFKYGIPSDADLVYDVRCLPNPFYIEELKNKTGLDECVSSYVMKYDKSKELLAKLEDIIDFSVPMYREEGKSELVIAFGCTGGKHRSVTFAEEMYKHLKENDLRVSVYHRDITKK